MIVSLQAEHLAHWGINMMSMHKTEKTMAELQIDLNISFEFDKMTESGAALQPLCGPGCVAAKCRFQMGRCLLELRRALIWNDAKRQP